MNQALAEQKQQYTQRFSQVGLKQPIKKQEEVKFIGVPNYDGNGLQAKIRNSLDRTLNNKEVSNSYAPEKFH